MQASELFVTAAGEWETVAPGVTRKILGYDGQLMMVGVKFESGAVGAMHHHPHRQVSYVAEGQFEVVIDGRTQILGAGDCFFVPPNAQHGAVAVTAGTLVDVFTPAREDFIK
jgi:quercetin dioxygenase-like cupin family protein